MESFELDGDFEDDVEVNLDRFTGGGEDVDLVHKEVPVACIRPDLVSNGKGIAGIHFSCIS